MKTLYISDLDGTLLGGDSCLSPISEGLLNTAISEGALFSIATARTPATVAWLMRNLNTNLPYVVMTGSAIWNPRDGSFSHTTEISPVEASRLISLYRRHHLPGFVYFLNNGIIDIYHIGPLSGQEREFIALREGSPYKVFHVPENGESQLPDNLSNISLFYSIQPEETVKGAYRDIITHPHSCTPIFYHDGYGDGMACLEIFAPEASKAKAIRRLKESVGADRLVVFGDNINDLPMLREADVAVAVENAVEEAKEIADIIIGPNTSDSVARFILEDFRRHNN